MLQRMLNRLRGANDDEKGFTLIELLVVILIIGILAAIALPTFLGQQKKAQNASAKSNVRNAVTQIESCMADATSSTVAACGTSANAGLAPILGVAADTGKVSLSVAPAFGTPNGGPTYTVVAKSKSNDTFTIAKSDGGAPAYTSSPLDAKWNEG